MKEKQQSLMDMLCADESSANAAAMQAEAVLMRETAAAMESEAATMKAEAVAMKNGTTQANIEESAHADGAHTDNETVEQEQRSIRLRLPATPEELLALRAGDTVYLSGEIYTARDAAHKRLCALIAAGAELPLDLRGIVIYYAGPCPRKPGQVWNSCGPTTSSRMDKFAPIIYENGAKGAIGKGEIAEEVIASMKKHGAVYFVATGGAGALISICVIAAQEVAFPELGAEAINRLIVRDMPVIVGVDAHGDDVFATAK